MRVEPYGIGSVVHIVKRGTRGMDIVRDNADRWRFTRSLYLLNDIHQTANRLEHNPPPLLRGQHKSDLCTPTVADLFKRPEYWPEREPLVSVLAWTLMPNHFHLLLRETRDGGVSKFMQRLCGSMSATFNKKYEETGSIFQGAFKGKTIDSDEYLRYVLAYIAVKNVLELHPRGLEAAVVDFDNAWEWAASYPFSSFRTVAHGDRSPIIDHEALADLGLPGSAFRRDSYDMLVGHMHAHADLTPLFLEDW